MSHKTILLSQVLMQKLPVSASASKDLYVQRALQERACAAVALQCIHAHAMCLEMEIDALADTSPEAAPLIHRMNSLLQDIYAAVTYSEAEMLEAEDLV